MKNNGQTSTLQRRLVPDPRQLVGQKAMPQVRLAQFCDISERMLSEWLSGRRPFTKGLLGRVSRHFKLCSGKIFYSEGRG